MIQRHALGGPAAADRRRFLRTALGASLAAFAWPHSRPARATPAPPVERVVIADERGDWGLPTPFTHARQGMGYALTSLVYDTLVWKNRDGTLIPSLATSWSADESRNTFTFELQPDAAWHDGRPVTAEDVRFTVEYAARHLYPFADLRMVEAVEAPAPGRVAVRLAAAYAPFMTRIAGTLPILPRHVFADIPQPRALSDPAKAIGSGPFRLAAYDKAQGRTLFTAVENHPLGRPGTGSVAVLRMPPAAAIDALRRGEVDMVRALPVHLAGEVTGPGLSVIAATSGHPYRLRFNHARPPFADRALRHAVAHAIDRAALLAIVEGGRGAVATPGWVQPGSPWFADVPPPDYPYDPARARRLFATATMPESLELLADPRFAPVARMVASQLEKAGLSIRIRLIESGTLEVRLDRGDFDLALLSQSVIGDPVSFTQQVIGDSPFSDRFTAREELTTLLRQQVITTDTTRRKAMLDRAQTLYAEEIPSCFLYTPVWMAAANRRVRPFFTPEGLGFGVPLPLNKLMFLT